MTTLSKKLHSQSGASILLALLLFLICGFTAAVTLGSATVNAKKYAKQRTEQQYYLSISSAARLIRDSLSETVIKGEEKKIEYKHDDPDLKGVGDLEETRYEPCPELTVVPSDGSTAAADDGLRAYLAKMVYPVFQANEEFRIPKAPAPVFPLKGSLEIASDPDLPVNPVHAEVSVDEDCTVTVALSVVDEGGSPLPYTMFVTFKTAVSGGGKGTFTQKITGQCSHSVTKDIPDENGVPHSTTFDISSDIETTTHTVTFTLDGGEIRKGDMTK